MITVIIVLRPTCVHTLQRHKTCVSDRWMLITRDGAHLSSCDMTWRTLYNTPRLYQQCNTFCQRDVSRGAIPNETRRSTTSTETPETNSKLRHVHWLKTVTTVKTNKIISHITPPQNLFSNNIPKTNTTHVLQPTIYAQRFSSNQTAED